MGNVMTDAANAENGPALGGPVNGLPPATQQAMYDPALGRVRLMSQQELAMGGKIKNGGPNVEMQSLDSAAQQQQTVEAAKRDAAMQAQSQTPFGQLGGRGRPRFPKPRRPGAFHP